MLFNAMAFYKNEKKRNFQMKKKVLIDGVHVLCVCGVCGVVCGVQGHVWPCEAM